MQNGTVTLIIYMVVFFGIMYFLMIRPQQKQAKQRQAMMSSLRANDKIITAGGIHGKIKRVKDDTVMIQIADKVEIELNKTGIASVENREIVVDNKKKNDTKADKKATSEKSDSKEAQISNKDAEEKVEDNTTEAK